MRWTARQVDDPGAALDPPPRDVEDASQVITAVGGATDGCDALRRAVEATVRISQGFGYGAAWTLDNAGGPRIVHQTGPLAPLEGSSPTDLDAEPVLGQAYRSRATVVRDDLAAVTGSARARAAASAGMAAALVQPVLRDGRVIGLLEFYAPRAFGYDEGRLTKIQAISRITDLAIANAVGRAELREVADDQRAVTSILNEVSRTRDPKSAARIALETVREAFGWAYGSFWKIEDDAVLRCKVESGDPGEEFRRVTLSATLAEGVGLAGRAWHARDLVFVPELAETGDQGCAPAAARAGFRSGIGMPVMVGDRVVGAMEFLSTDRIEVSESRAAALRNVQQLVSQRLEVLFRLTADEQNARALLETVSQLRAATHDASQVADEAVMRAGTMSGDVQNLGQASEAIGNVIKIISGIAAQTNLLALNATIEAARAGDVGKGFAVVAGEVKDLARETSEATGQVADQIAAIQANCASVAAGIHATSEIIGRMDSVQVQIGEVLKRQGAMAATFEEHARG